VIRGANRLADHTAPSPTASRSAGSLATAGVDLGDRALRAAVAGAEQADPHAARSGRHRLGVELDRAQPVSVRVELEDGAAKVVHPDLAPCDHNVMGIVAGRDAFSGGMEDGGGAARGARLSGAGGGMLHNRAGTAAAGAEHGQRHERRSPDPVEHEHPLLARL
jgi:hypothetical protein